VLKKQKSLLEWRILSHHTQINILSVCCGFVTDISISNYI
jgi:hypothetical protein